MTLVKSWTCGPMDSLSKCQVRTLETTGKFYNYPSSMHLRCVCWDQWLCFKHHVVVGSRLDTLAAVTLAGFCRYCDSSREASDGRWAVEYLKAQFGRDFVCRGRRMRACNFRNQRDDQGQCHRSGRGEELVPWLVLIQNMIDLWPGVLNLDRNPQSHMERSPNLSNTSFFLSPASGRSDHQTELVRVVRSRACRSQSRHTRAAQWSQ